MKQSPKQQIDSIIRYLEKHGVQATPVVESANLATSHPEAISDFVMSVIGRFPKGGTFLHLTFSFLPQERWSEVVEFALNALEVSGGTKDAARSVIDYASFQCPQALHPHLDRLFQLQLHYQSYIRAYPWRESGEQHFPFLRSTLEHADSTDDERELAWVALHETRHANAVSYATSYAEMRSNLPFLPRSDEWIRGHLHRVGFHSENYSLRRLCTDSLYHLQLSPSFFVPLTRPHWLERIHPTWQLPDSIQTLQFGGMGQNACSSCGQKQHRLLTLDPIPAGLGVTGMGKLELDTCLSCLGWEQQQLFYKHDDDGIPFSVCYGGPSVVPQFPVGPLRETEVGLSSTPRRWFWQDWACSNSRENLNRIGGEPCWIQDAEYPNCPFCLKTMHFLFQLDSDLPTASGKEWLWGSGGIAYGFWCDECKVSGFLWQCT